MLLSLHENTHKGFKTLAIIPSIHSLSILIAVFYEVKWYSYILIVLIFVCYYIFTFFFKKRSIRTTALMVTFLLSFYTRPDLRTSLADNSINNGMKLYNNLYYKIHGYTMFSSSLSYQHEPYKEGSWNPPNGYSNAKVKLSNCNAYLLKRKETKKNHL